MKRYLVLFVATIFLLGVGPAKVQDGEHTSSTVTNKIESPKSELFFCVLGYCLAQMNGSVLTIIAKDQTTDQDVIHLKSGPDKLAKIRGDNAAGISLRGGGSGEGYQIDLHSSAKATEPSVLKILDDEVEIARFDNVGTLHLQNKAVHSRPAGFFSESVVNGGTSGATIVNLGSSHAIVTCHVNSGTIGCSSFCWGPGGSADRCAIMASDECTVLSSSNVVKVRNDSPGTETFECTYLRLR